MLDKILDKFEKATNTIEVCNLGYEYPNYKKKLFQLLVQPANFQRLVSSTDEVCFLILNFRNNLKELFQQLVQPTNFPRLVTSSDQVCQLSVWFSHYKEELFQLVIQPANLERLVTNTRQLSALVRAFPEKEILIKSTIKANSPEQKAYTQGAAMGFFETFFPPEVANHIGSFLDRKSGAQLALTIKKAADTARSEYKNKEPETTPPFIGL